MLIGIQGYCSSTYMIKWKVQRGHLNSTPILFSANIALTALCKSQTNNIFHHLSGSKFKYNWLLSLFNVKNTKMNMHCLCLVSCVCKCLGIVFVLCLVSAGVSGLSMSCVLCLPVSRDYFVLCLVSAIVSGLFCHVSCVCWCLGIVFVLCRVSAGVSGLSLSCVLCLPVSRDCLCPVSCVCRCLGIVHSWLFLRFLLF